MDNLTHGLRSNGSPQGDAFLKAFVSAGERMREDRELFSEFVEANGFSAWHIHDGWFTDTNLRAGSNVINLEEALLNWIGSHESSHSLIFPEVGSTMLIISDFPDTKRHEKPVDVYEYKIFDGSSKVIFSKKSRLLLKKLDTHKVYFNRETGSYEFYQSTVKK